MTMYNYSNNCRFNYIFNGPSPAPFSMYMRGPRASRRVLLYVGGQKHWILLFLSKMKQHFIVGESRIKKLEGSTAMQTHRSLPAFRISELGKKSFPPSDNRAIFPSAPVVKTAPSQSSLLHSSVPCVCLFQ